MDIYDEEIERCIKMTFNQLELCWSYSATSRWSSRPFSHDASLLFAYCGNSDTRNCGCPTLIRENSGSCDKAATPALTKKIRAMNKIPKIFGNLRTRWNRASRAQRRAILRPFAEAQRLTDKVLEKLAGATA